MREIARQLGRRLDDQPELARGCLTRRPRGRTGPSAAQARAEPRARRPKRASWPSNPRLRAGVQDKLETAQWSPEQIAGRLLEDFPDDESMRISHETIYQALYVQGRGELRRELTACLRTGRALRRPRRRPTAAGNGSRTRS